jgi:hypothetical protein
MAYHKLWRAYKDGGMAAAMVAAEAIVTEMVKSTTEGGALPMPTTPSGLADEILCPVCGVGEIWQVEDGYTRYTTHLRVDENGVVHLFSDGWDDYSDNGEWNYYQCQNYQCEQYFYNDTQEEWD